VGLTLTTGLPVYPEGVGLTAGPLPTGLAVTFAPSLVAPTLSGATTTATITTSATLPSGTYRVPVLAQGSGVTQTLDLEVKVAGKGFGLAAASNALTLNPGGHTQFTLTTAVEGGNSPVSLHLAGAPVGLMYTWSAETIASNGVATLTLSDTTTLFGGVYTLSVVASDGVTTVESPITLTVSKPGVGVTMTPQHLTLTAGSSTSALLSLSVYGGWTAPVSLSLDLASLPPGISAGIAQSTPAGVTSASGLPGTVTLSPTSNVWIVITVNADVEESSIDLPIVVTADGYEARRSVRLEVTANATNQVQIWLPFLGRN
jgi:uncharacterized membrane protein